MQDVTIKPASPVSLGDEMKLVPGWSIALGGVFFVVMQVLAQVLMAREPNPPPAALIICAGLLGGAVMAVWTMLVGYVNVDSGRRGMSRLAWTLLVILVPNALGFVLYFLLRQPAQQPCPQCGAVVLPGFNYCPKCNCKLHPHCAQCQRPVSLSDTFCPYCGFKLDEIVHSSG